STIVRSFLRMVLSSLRSQAISSRPGDSILVSRSPAAMRTTHSTVASTDALMPERMIPADSSAIAQPAAAPTPTTQAASVAACGGAPAAACSSAAVAHAPNTANVAAMTQHRITTWRTRLMLRIHSVETLHRGLEWQTAPTGTLSGAGPAGSDDKRPNPGAF